MSSVAKQKNTGDRPGLFSELFKAGLYKPNQGRITRQLTFVAIALLGCLSAWELQRSKMMVSLGGASLIVMVGIAAALVWIGYRLVNYSVFADFLIAVEAEMNKVSWPNRAELWKASVVVMFVIFSMAAFLFAFDAVWTAFFEAIGIRYSGDGSIVGSLLRKIGIWK